MLGVDVISAYSICSFAAAAVVICVTWFVKSIVASLYRRRRLDEKLCNQSYIYDAEENIRTSSFSKDGPMVDKMMGYLSTIHEVFHNGKKVSENGPCFGWRPTPNSPYEWMTYAESYRRICLLGSGLEALKPADLKDKFFIGIYATNCVEWALTQQACSTFGYVIIPIYDTLGVDSRKHILRQTELSVCLCDSATKVSSILEDSAITGNWVKHIVIIAHANDKLDTLREESRARGVQVHTFEEILAMGREGARPENLPQADDLHLICYTSGTTGKPKGVMITHRMIVSVIAGFHVNVHELKIGPGDCYLSFLPLAHVFEQIVMHYNLGLGSAVGFYGGDIQRLFDDILALRPTIFVAVPRVFQRLYSNIQESVVKSFYKKWLLKIAVTAKMAYVREGITTRNTFWDKYILKPIQDRMGGRLRLFACGSAPVSEEAYSFCRTALGVHAFEAYGLTETCGAMIMTVPNDYVSGHVGPPLSCCMVKLTDVPDMNIVVTRDNIGEVCVKGPSCTNGYYKDSERTAEVIDADGWFHTGDVGQWTPRGTLKVVDRCKNMFKLAQGEYVSPERVEMVYSQSRLVNQIFIDGNPRESFAIAICVPNIKILRETVRLEREDPIHGLVDGDLKEADISDEQVCAMKEACLTVLKDLIRLGNEAGLKGFEQAKSIYLTPNDFTVDSGLLTPTAKKLRGAFRRTFKAEIDRLYEGEMIL